MSGQESVWDYPRPPGVEEAERQVKVVFNGEVIAETRRATRVLETSHPPFYYIPQEDTGWNTWPTQVSALGASGKGRPGKAGW